MKSGIPEYDRLVNMAGGCVEVVRERFGDLSRLGAELEALDGATCNGREYWRDLDHVTRQAKLYILHSIDQACPLHGDPPPGERLRVYVGSDPGKVEEAREAIARDEYRRELQAELEQARRGLATCTYYLHSFYGRLGYTVGDDGRPLRGDRP